MLCKYRLVDCPTDWLMALFHSLPNWGVGPHPGTSVNQLCHKERSPVSHSTPSLPIKLHKLTVCVHKYGSVCLSVWARQRDRYPVPSAVQLPITQSAEESPAWTNLHVRACAWTMPRTADSFCLSLRSSLIASVLAPLLLHLLASSSLSLHTFLLSSSLYTHIFFMLLAFTFHLLPCTLSLSINVAHN